MIPQRLKKGDCIGIVSPSDPLTKEIKNQFEKGIKVLEGMGFKVLLGKHLSSQNPKEKAADINDLFSNKKVKAIMCTQGGDSAEKILPLINWKEVKNNPKIFMGISDITFLLNAIYQKTGLITFHGNDVCYGFGRNPTSYDKQEFFNIVVKGDVKEIKPNRERKTIRKGKATGKLLGGNLRCLLKLADTEYWPDFKESILILEAYKIDKEKCLQHFQKLKEKKVFDQVKGVIIGFIYSMQEETPEEEQMEDTLLEFTKEYKFPILKINDFGHNCPNTILPVGCKVELNANKKTIKFLEGCVE